VKQLKNEAPNNGGFGIYMKARTIGEKKRRVPSCNRTCRFSQVKVEVQFRQSILGPLEFMVRAAWSRWIGSAGDGRGTRGPGREPLGSHHPATDLPPYDASHEI